LDWFSTPKNSETVQTDPTAPPTATSTEEAQSIDTTKEETKTRSRAAGFFSL
jgi:hypothetical protein